MVRPNQTWHSKDRRSGDVVVTCTPHRISRSSRSLAPELHYMESSVIAIAEDSARPKSKRTWHNNSKTSRAAVELNCKEKPK
jgi:hypothetical protein